MKKFSRHLAKLDLLIVVVVVCALVREAVADNWWFASFWAVFAILDGFALWVSWRAPVWERKREARAWLDAYHGRRQTIDTASR